MKAHTFTDTRILNIHGTKWHCGCICVCGRWCGFQMFPVSVSVKGCVPNNASQQCFPEVTNFGMAQRCYSKNQLWKPVRWGNVQHSLNMSSVTCIHVHHWLATNDFNYSDGFMHILWWISAYYIIGLKVVGYLPSKDIVGNDVTSCICVSWMIFLRHESVRTFGRPSDFSSCAYLSSWSSGRGVSVALCVFAYAYECV
jgi:hypothetical protein